MFGGLRAHRERLAVAGMAAAVALAVVAGCSSAPAPTELSAANAPVLLDNMGASHRDTGSRVPAAQRYFDQGLRLT